MSLKAVFIDVGNTLLYEKPSRFEIYAEEARRRAVQMDATAMRQLMVRAHRELPREIGGSFRYSDPWFIAYLERLFHDYLGLLKTDLPAVREQLFSRFSDPETFVLYPGVHELFDALRTRGLQIGIVSNWSPRLPLLFDRLDLARRVDFILCSAVERLEKPDPLIFEKALRLARVRADEALHAGDDIEKDVLGARRAGLRSVHVDHERYGDAGNAPRVHDLHELRELVTRLVDHG